MPSSPQFRRNLCALVSACLVLQPALALDYQYQVAYAVSAADRHAGAGQLRADPPSHDFGTLVEGSASAYTVSLTNAGGTPVRQTVISVAAPFSQTNNCPADIGPDASCQVVVSYAPAAAGSHQGALHVAADLGGVDVPLAGRAVPAMTGMGLSTSALSFAATAVGLAGATQDVILTNSGNVSTTISGIGVTSGVADFNQSNNCASLAAGASCRIAVSFVPSMFGVRVGNLSVYDSATGSLYSVALQGTGIAPALRVASSVVTIPDTVVGDTHQGVIALRNEGNDSVQGLNASLSGSSSMALSAGTCTATLTPGTSCDLAIQFQAQAAGGQSATATISASNAPTITATVNANSVAQAPLLSASPAPVNFSNTNAGTGGQRKNVTVTNVGNVAVSVSGVSVVDGAADFVQSNNCNAPLAVGASCVVDVLFNPTGYGARTGSLSVSYANVLLAVELAGTGVQGSLQASASTLDFGSAIMGATGVGKSVTLTNAGNADLALVSFSHAGADFTVDTSACASTLAPQQSCDAKVVFTPSATSARTGSLSIATPANTVSVTFNGAGVQGNASLSSAALAFAAVQQGTSSPSQSVTLTNNGSAPLTVSAVALASGAGNFTQTNNCSSVAVGATCTVDVVFAPSVTGNVTGSLLITHNGTGATQVSLTGASQAASASLSAPVFAGTPVGTSSTAIATLTNTGLGSLTVTPPVAASVTGGDFAFVSSTCAGVLAPAASCPITVRFTASNAGAATGALTLATSAGNQLVSLGAQATQGQASLSRSSVTFATTQVASTAAQSIVLTNTGTAPLTVSSVVVSGGTEDFAQANNCAGIPANGTCTINATFTPTLAGARNGAITLTHNGSGAVSVALSGIGQAASATLSNPTFAATKVGSSSTATATLTNTGLAAISVTPPAPTAVFGSDFHLQSSACPASLAAGASCAIVVQFSPSSPNGSTGSLAVLTQAGTQSVQLSTTGIQGVASISPGSLSFSAQQVGSSSGVKTVIVTNTGTATLQFTGVGIVSGASDFAQSNDCASVPVNGTCTVNVSFAPNTAGLRNGVIGFTHDGGGVATISLSGDARAAGGVLSAPAFSSTGVGAASTSTATLTNTGVGALALTVPSSSSVTGADFGFNSTTCTASLASGASCDIVVRFSPSAAVSRTGSLSVDTAAGTKTATFSGTGIQGSVSANPGALSFATQQVGSTSGTQTFTLTNTGSAALALSGIGMVSGSSDFAQSNNCATLAVNASCTVNIAFTPNASGARAGVLGLSHNGSGVTTLNLSGSGQSASASMTTPSFAATPVGSRSTAVAVLTNTGVGSLSVSLPGTIWAGSSTDFTYSATGTTCTAVLASGASCNIAVAFAPTANIARTGTLVVSTDAGDQIVALGSTGIQGFASVSPASLGFAAQQVGSTSALKVVTVTNTGSDILTFASVGVTAGAADFGQSNNCASVPVNGSCLVYVTFTPSTGGARTGSLALTHNGGGVAIVSLSGSGQVPSAAVSAPAFPGTVITATSTATATVSNTGIGTITLTTPVAASVLGADFSFVSTNCGTSLAAGANCTVTIQFTPTTTATRSGSVTVQTSAGAQAANWTAAATPVDYSANLAAYVNPQVVTYTHPAWYPGMSPWYSVNAGGSVAVQPGTRGVGRTVTIAGTGPVSVKLRFVADDGATNLRVNGVLVQADVHASYDTVKDTVTFTLYPGVNSITIDVINAGGAPNPGGWIFQLWDAAGSAMLADASGWKFTGAPEPVTVLLYDGSNFQYADTTVAASCKQYRQPNPGYTASAASGYYKVNMGAGVEVVYCDMVTDGGGWTLVARSHPSATKFMGFGWNQGVGSPGNMSGQYSLNLMSKNLNFTEALFGSASGSNNNWSTYVYKNAMTRSLVNSNQTTQVYVGYPTPIAGGNPSFAMSQCLGNTTSASRSYFFRDGCVNLPDDYGLFANGWDTDYGDGPNDIAGQPVGAYYAGYINHAQGLLMVR